MDIKMFQEICKMTQPEVKKYVAEELLKTHDKVIVSDGFVFAQGKLPVLLLAHMDTVHDKTPEKFEYDPFKQIISSPQGIGGDDRCGIYMVLNIAKKYNCSILFCEDEEVGAVGAQNFVKTELATTLEFNYAIEFDRQGSNDAVFYDCDNEEFEEFITEKFYKTAWGSFSDISIVAPALGCAAVNLSCGYYKAHTKAEYVVLPEMEASMEAACKILDRTTEKDKFEYIEAKHYSIYGNKHGWFDDVEECYLIEFIDENGEEDWCSEMALNELEAIGRFCIEHPNIPYENIMDIYCDNYYL